MAKLADIEKVMGDLHSKMQLNPFIFYVISLLSFILVLHKLITRGSKLKLPPSPPKLPLIGNLHQLGLLPHRSLKALAEKYGPLMFLHFGTTPTLVVSSDDTAKEIMKTHDIVLANRPKSIKSDIFFYGGKDIGFAPYGDYWRSVKKLGVLELLSVKRVQSFQYVREEEVSTLVRRIQESCLDGASIDISKMLLSLSNNVVSRCVLGMKAEAEGEEGKFGELTRRMMSQFAAFSFSDTIPSLGWMDHMTGLISRIKATKSEIDVFLGQVIEEHRKSLASVDETKLDFVHIILQLQESGMIEIQLSQENLKAIVMDMFVGGTDTTATEMEWLMAELIRHENVMSKIQEEVRRIVGQKSKVEAEDIARMSYLKCVIKETLRLHPSLPLLVPRETSSSVELLPGYTIPPKTAILVNAFAIQRDPKLWDRPDEFIPERFENSSVGFKGQDLLLMPFGGGRRSCPGMTFAVAIIEFAIANLLYWFDWKLPDGAAATDLDMTEAAGLAVVKKTPLYLLPSMYNP